MQETYKQSKQVMKYQMLQPLYMREAQRVWDKHEQPIELQTILEQNFVNDIEGSWRVPDPKKESDLEQIRHRADEGIPAVPRYERQAQGGPHGSLACRIQKILAREGLHDHRASAKRVPEAVIQEDPALLMYFDNASLMLGD